MTKSASAFSSSWQPIFIDSDRTLITYLLPTRVLTYLLQKLKIGTNGRALAVT